MKRILSLALALALTLSCAFLMFSCNTDDKDDGNDEVSIAGVYEMTSISGSITTGGETIALEENMYDYYVITLNEDGTAIVKSAAAGTNQELRQNGTWEYDEKTGALDLISTNEGISVVEKMTLKDGKISYTTNTTGQAMGVTMTINMTIILERAED